jgi:hypothetical protein
MNREAEDQYLEEHQERSVQLRAMVDEARTEKIAILNRAGLACTEDDDDAFLFHNPFVWMDSDKHHPWPGVDYDIAVGILVIEAEISQARDEFREWEKLTNPYFVALRKREAEAAK